MSSEDTTIEMIPAEESQTTEENKVAPLTLEQVKKETESVDLSTAWTCRSFTVHTKWLPRFLAEEAALAENVACRIVHQVVANFAYRCGDPETWVPIGERNESLTVDFRLAPERPHPVLRDAVDEFEAGMEIVHQVATVEQVQAGAKPTSLIGDWIRHASVREKNAAALQIPDVNFKSSRKVQTSDWNRSAIAEWMNVLAKDVRNKVEAKLSAFQSAAKNSGYFEFEATVEQASGHSFSKSKSFSSSLKSSSHHSTWPEVSVKLWIPREDPNDEGINKAVSALSNSQAASATPSNTVARSTRSKGVLSSILTTFSGSSD